MEKHNETGVDVPEREDLEEPGGWSRTQVVVLTIIAVIVIAFLVLSSTIILP